MNLLPQVVLHPHLHQIQAAVLPNLILSLSRILTLIKIKSLKRREKYEDQSMIMTDDFSFEEVDFVFFKDCLF